jgi:hypothetical protein
MKVPGGSGERKFSMTATGNLVYDDRMFTIWAARQIDTVRNQDI